MNLTCIAIDDEPISLAIIAQFCKRLGHISVTCYSDPIHATKCVQEELPDIVFLDIEMHGTLGTEVAKLLPKECNIIFVTAYANYAVEGFELNAIDYLLKPIGYDRFVTAVEKVVERKQLQESNERSIAYSGGEITVKVGHKNQKIQTNLISHLEAMDNYTKLFMLDGVQIVLQMNLKAAARLLDAHDFIRIHRSFIVAKSRITRYSRKEVYISNLKSALPVGRAYSAGFWASMNK